MCILSKSHYAKLGVSNLFFQELSKKNLKEVGSTPPSLVQEGSRISLHPGAGAKWDKIERVFPYRPG